MTYKEGQRIYQTNLLKDTTIFDAKANNMAVFFGVPREFVLKNGKYNLYKGIMVDAEQYFNQHNIQWWGGKRVPGHILSSQISCVNHLFPLRKDKKVLLEMLNKATNRNFIDLLPIPGSNGCFVDFEVVSNSDHLSEGFITRGSNCTSVDALMIAKDQDNVVWLIPIEWKYTEVYQSFDKSNEDRRYSKKTEPNYLARNAAEKGKNAKGKERMDRYNDLIIKVSSQLKTVNPIQGSIYYQEPFYQLMRQTLWVEQVIQNESANWHNATKFIHLHIVPDKNVELLNHKFKRFPNSVGMVSDWKKQLKDPNLYIRVDPKAFLSPLNNVEEYNDLFSYLEKRYWN